ncbi:hypothetical protein JOF42_002355 [Microbacterium phyllosphaerae]|uniref:Uncharacterized protein n=1 Tax=Microbacterium phyllosphaerae TaxID=124798 RepID=A0ABS4WRN1_9MICO|nr:hypothetical protein [Microbacterium phyllosphaerae]MBP2378860.1 hypothetical protein [Microbacterium phyllosphaerae]
MGTSKRLAPYYDMQAQHQAILTAAKQGPLQSLSDRELGVRETPVTIYPPAAQRRVRAWVRFGLEPVCVDAKVVRSTPLAAGIEFKAGDRVFRCWVWGNAVSSQDD